jgi:di/tricarboxylate transporter
VNDQFTVSVAREALPGFGAQYRIMVATVLAGVALTAFAPRIRLVSRVVVTGCLFFALITVVVMPKSCRYSPRPNQGGGPYRKEPKP